MRIVEPKVELIWVTPNPEEIIESAGRTCYKSEDLITKDSSQRFIKSIIKSGHESVLEHASASFRLITNRFTTHQIVRHRLFSYSQESQRYCNYTKDKFDDEICFVPPEGLEDLEHWKIFCKNAENAYKIMVGDGCKPQIARSVLPSSCKTELIMTGNFRNWRHFFKLRCSTHAQEDIRLLAYAMRIALRREAPTVFGE